MPPLQDILRLLTRPIEFASNNDSAHLSSIQNLGPFVTQQVLMALTEKIFIPSIEADLLALRQLFSDYHNGLPFQERKQRLSEAGKILTRLQQYHDGEARTRHPESQGPPSERGGDASNKMKRMGARELWEIAHSICQGRGSEASALAGAYWRTDG